MPLPGMQGNRKRFAPPALLALLVQLAAFALVFVSVRLAAFELSWISLAFVLGTLAAFLSRLLSMDSWWLPIEFLFAPAMVGALSLQLSSTWYLGGFMLLALVYWSVFQTRVPLFLTSRQAHAALAELLPYPSGFRLIDLGSGLAGVLAALSRLRPGGHYVGIESAPLPMLISKLRLLGKPNCSIAWGSYWQRDLSEFDVVYAYLSPAPMEQLWRKVRTEMKPGSLFISNTFEVPGMVPERTIALNDLSGSVLHVWRM
jgi:hypothetical protein